MDITRTVDASPDPYLDRSSPPPPLPVGALRTAARLAFALLVLSQVGATVFLAWEPAFDGSIRYDDVAAMDGAYWPMNALLGGPSFALGAVTLSVFLAVLGVGRGNRLALVGVTLHLVGGLVFALVVTAEVLPFAWAADPAVAEAEGRALVDSYNGRLDALLPYILGSMALTALGALVAVVGGTVSGRIGRWVPVVALLVILGVFLLPLGSPLSPVVDLAQRALLVYLGWGGLRQVGGHAPGPR